MNTYDLSGRVAFVTGAASGIGADVADADAVQSAVDRTVGEYGGARLVSWLASSDASFVTGSYYTVDGGYTAR